MKALFVLSFALVSPVLASDQVDSYALETVTVTGARTGVTNLQTTGITITSFDQYDLLEQNATNVKDIAHFTPGLSIGQNQSYAQIFIRGVGTNNVFPGADTSSTVHFDDVYLSRPKMIFSDFLDIEQVEVLKGPQGTLYGRNSIGGTIHIKPALPTDELMVTASTDFGSDGRRRIASAARGPLIEDTLMAGLSFFANESDGYVDDVTDVNTKDLNDEGRFGLRGTVRWLFSPDLAFILSSDYTYVNETPPASKPTFKLSDGSPANVARVINDPFAVATNFASTNNIENAGLHAKVKWTISEHYTLSSVSAYRTLDAAFRGDTDYTEIEDVDFSEEEEQHQFTQEFQLSKTTGAFTWLLGAFYFDEHIDYNFVNNTTLQSAINRNLLATPLQAILDIEVDTQSYAAFFQGTYALTDKWSVILGSRYNVEKRTISGNEVAFNIAAPAVFGPEASATIRESAFTPKLGVEYRLSDQVFLYGTISEGFKSGGFNFAAVFNEADYQSENLTAYEIGMKSTWLNNRLRVNTTAFYYDYENLQVQGFENFVGTIANAKASEIIGAELETSFKPSSAWRFDAGISYLDATYTDFNNASDLFDNVNRIEFDASGNRLNNSPEWTVNLTARYYQDVADGLVTYRLNYYWQDQEFFTTGNLDTKSQSAYELLNASISYSTYEDRLELIAYGDNLTNRDYVNTAFDFNLNAGIVGTINPPRTFGLKAIFRFE